MNRNTNKIIISVLLIGSFFLLGESPDNFQFKEMINAVSDKEVVIVFNSGGWGNTPLNQADDFRPVIEGIQKTLKDLGYNSVVIPYERTKESFFGIIEGLKETFTLFQKQSQKLAIEIEDFIDNNPENKVIVTGLSNGGAFTDKVMEKISEDKRNSVFAIEVGTPFWENVLDSDSVLLLDNQGKDPLSAIDLKILLPSFLKAPIKWSLAKISGQELSLGHALRLPGHYYDWEEIAPEIRLFLENNLVLF